MQNVNGTAAPAAADGRGGLRERLTSPGSLVVGAAMVAVLVVLIRRVGDPDFWWHLATARWILDNHALPSHDLFTYTVPGHVWTDHEYGTELFIIGLFRAGGFAAVSLGFALVTWLGFWLILARTRLQRTPALITAAVLGLAAVTGVAVWGPRSQMVTFAFTCLELYWLEAYMRGRSRALYWLPLVVVLWANLHGGFVVSLVFVGVAMVVEAVLAVVSRGDGAHRGRALRLLAVLVACGVAGLVSPHGFELYTYAVKTQFSSVQQGFIAEWHSPDFHRLDERGLEAMILLLAIGFAVRRPRLWDVAVGVVATVLALQSVRHTVIFVAAVAPIIAWSYGEAWDALALRRRMDGWTAARVPLLRGVAALLIVACVAGTAVVARSTLRGQSASTAANFPTGAADWLAAHPQTGTRMFNAYDWGGYLIYRFDYPPERTRPVFSFGEAELMGDPLMQELSDIENAKPDWQDILDRNGVDYVVERPDSPLSMALSIAPGWTKAYDDGFAVIFAKQSG